MFHRLVWCVLCLNLYLNGAVVKSKQTLQHLSNFMLQKIFTISGGLDLGGLAWSFSERENWPSWENINFPNVQGGDLGMGDLV